MPRQPITIVPVDDADLYCLPICAAKLLDAALTLPTPSPLLKSCEPCSVMFSGGIFVSGSLPKNRVIQTWAVLNA